MTPLFMFLIVLPVLFLMGGKRKTLDELRADDEKFMALLSSGQARNRTRELREWNTPEDSP